MTEATPTPAARPSLRIPIECPATLDDPDFEERLEAGDLMFVESHQGEALQSVVWHSVDPEYEGTVTLSRPRENEDLGCAYISGPSSVDLAMSLATYLRYVPVGLLHLGAREAPERQVRVASLRVLSQVYMLEAGLSYWDAAIDSTTHAVRHGPDRELRRHALLIELVGHPSAARQHLQELLEEEKDEQERRQLESLLEVARRTSGAWPAADVSATKEPELRLAFAHVLNGTYEEVLECFDPVCTIVQEQKTDVGGRARMVELEAKEADARMTWVVHESAEVGGVYFQGPEALTLAYGASRALCYLPVELARQAARSSQYWEFRVKALQALALAASEHILPSRGMDPQDRALLQQALTDQTPEVKGMALNLSLFLRDELARQG